jgi:hypothetical protein
VRPLKVAVVCSHLRDLLFVTFNTPESSYVITIQPAFRILLVTQSI